MVKFGKFQKKKIDEDTFIMCKVKGKMTGKLAKEIKKVCNEAVRCVMDPDVTEPTE